MRRRFWRAVFRYAAPRTGWPRYAKDRDEQMDAAYAEWEASESRDRAALRLVQLRTRAWSGETSAPTITSTIPGATVTWRTS